MKIFITGGSGFLGKQVIKRLITEGHSVTALARSESSRKIVEQLGATAQSGDIHEIKSFFDVLKTFDIVIHAAAPVEFWGPWQKYQAGIIDSTLELANACAQQGVKRFIHISSESVLQDKEPLLNINEDYAYPDQPNSFYGKAKKIVEQKLLQLNCQMEIIILRPTFIWGPGCPAYSTLEAKVRADRFIWIDKGENLFEAVHVENVVEAINLALTKGHSKRIYFVTDDEVSTVKQFFESLFKSLNLPIPKASVQGFLIKPIAYAVEIIWKSLRIKSPPPLTRFDLAFVSQPRKYNIDLLKADMGYKSVMTRKKFFEIQHQSF